MHRIDNLPSIYKRVEGSTLIAFLLSLFTFLILLAQLRAVLSMSLKGVQLMQVTHAVTQSKLRVVTELLPLLSRAGQLSCGYRQSLYAIASAELKRTPSGRAIRGSDDSDHIYVTFWQALHLKAIDNHHFRLVGQTQPIHSHDRIQFSDCQHEVMTRVSTIQGRNLYLMAPGLPLIEGVTAAIERRLLLYVKNQSIVLVDSAHQHAEAWISHVRSMQLYHEGSYHRLGIRHDVYRLQITYAQGENKASAYNYTVITNTIPWHVS